MNAIWHRPAAYYKDSDWHGKRDKDGGILFTQFSHFIDLLCWLLGDISVIGSIQGNFGLRGIIEDEDTGVLMMRTNQGAIGTMHYTVGAYEKNMEGSFTLLGEKGTVKIGGEYLNELDYFRVEGMEAPALAASRPANEYGAYKGSMSNQGDARCMMNCSRRWERSPTIWLPHWKRRAPSLLSNGSTRLPYRTDHARRDDRCSKHDNEVFKK